MIKQFLISNFKFSNIFKIILCLIFNFALLTLNLSEAAAQTQPNLADYVWNPPPLVATPSAALDLRQKLTNEIEKMIQDTNGNGKYDDHVAPLAFVRGLKAHKEFYFVNPAENLLTLSTAYPYVPAATQAKIKEYLSYDLVTFPPTQSDICPRWGNDSCFRDGVRREYAPLPSDFPQSIYWKHAYGETELDGPSLENLYGLWAYGYYLGEWNYLQAHYTEIKNIYTGFKNWMASQGLTQPKYLTQIGGLIGFARIAQQFGDTALAQEAANYAILGLQAASGNGFATFRQNSESLITNYSTAWETDPYPEFLYFTIPLFFYDYRALDVADLYIPYMTLFPKELGQFLHDYSQTQVQDFLNKVEAFHPGWSLTEPANSFWTEETYNPQHDKWTIFKLHAYVLGDSQEQLKKYLDVPISMGDLFYMQMLVATIEAPGGSTQPCTLTSSSWNPTSTTQGSTVVLNVNTSGSCSNQQVNLTIFKNGLCGGQLNTTITPNPAPITNNLASASWISEYTSDICGVLGSPNQYYFNATLGTQSITSSLLSVSPSITPTPTPTPSVVPTPTSTPGPISGNDWPQVQRDANHSGYVPQTVGPPYTELWRWTAAPVSIRVQPIIAQGLVFMPSNDGKLYAINKDTGLNSWVFDTGSGKPLVASAAYDSGVIFFGSTDGHIYAVDVGTNTQRWKYPTTDKIGSIRSAPIVANSTLFIGSSDGKMYALDTSSGALKWSYDIGAPILDTAAYYNGMIYFGGMDSKGYALDANTGSLVWSKQLYGQGFKDRWTVAGNGKVIFTTMPYYPPVTRLGDQGTFFLHNLWSQGINDWPTQRDAIRNLLQNDPFLRSTYVLDATSGAETNIAPILYISGGSTSVPSQPVLLPNGDVNVIYRWTAGIEPLWGQMTSSAIFLGQMDLGTGDITQLDDWGTTDPNSFDITKHILFISDESSALMRSGDIIYIDSSRGTVGFDLNTKQVLPFSSYVTWSGGVYINPPIIFYKNTTSSIDWYSAISVWPNAEQWSSGNDFKRPTPLADDVFYMFHYNTLIAVKGTKR